MSTQSSLSSVIAGHIDEIEVAVRYVHDIMDPFLSKQIGTRLEDKRKELGWAGEVDEELEPLSWLAPEEWRMAGDDDDSFDLFMNFAGADCVDGSEPETWLARLLGFAGSGWQFEFGSNSLGRVAWKTLLRKRGDLIEDLVAAGFRCDVKEGVLALPVHFNRADLVRAFEDDEFDLALAPMTLAIDKILSVRKVLDGLVKAIREKA